MLHEVVPLCAVALCWWCWGRNWVVLIVCWLIERVVCSHRAGCLWERCPLCVWFSFFRAGRMNRSWSPLEGRLSLTKGSVSSLQTFSSLLLHHWLFKGLVRDRCWFISYHEAPGESRLRLPGGLSKVKQTRSPDSHKLKDCVLVFYRQQLAACFFTGGSL